MYESCGSGGAAGHFDRVLPFLQTSTPGDRIWLDCMCLMGIHRMSYIYDSCVEERLEIISTGLCRFSRFIKELCIPVAYPL